MAATLLAWAAPAFPAPGNPLESARGLMRELRFDEAAKALRATLSQGVSASDELASLYFLWGEAEASMGRVEYAEQLFGRGLELAPSRLLPADAPPKVQRPFSSARAKLRGRALRPQVLSEWLSDGRVRTRVAIKDDVYGLARAATLLPEGATVALPFSQVPEGEVTWACDRVPCGYTVEVRDEFGNTLRKLGEASAPLTVDRPALQFGQGANPTTVEARRGLRAAWPYLAAAAALGIASGVLAVQFAQTQGALVDASQNRPQHTYAQIQALDRDRRSLQLGLFSTSAAMVGAGIGAAVTW